MTMRSSRYRWVNPREDNNAFSHQQWCNISGTNIRLMRTLFWSRCVVANEMMRIMNRQLKPFAPPTEMIITSTFNNKIENIAYKCTICHRHRYRRHYKMYTIGQQLDDTISILIGFLLPRFIHRKKEKDRYRTVTSWCLAWHVVRSRWSHNNHGQ